MKRGAFRPLALFAVIIVLLACTAALVLRGVNAVEYAGLNRYRQSDAELAATLTKGRVVFFGDSITNGWDLGASFPGHPYVNRGINGQTTSQMLLRFHQDVVNLRPESVVILGGINDLAVGASIEQIENNYAGMAEMARVNHLRIYIGSVLPVGSSHRSYGAKNIIALNEWLQKYCSQTGATYIDYWQKLVDQNGLLSREFSADGLHPNPAGYAVMTEVIDRELGSNR